MTEIMYVYYIIMKFYVLVYINKNKILIIYL
jgi:hypothetical protein